MMIRKNQQQFYLLESYCIKKKKLNLCLLINYAKLYEKIITLNDWSDK